MNTYALCVEYKKLLKIIYFLTFILLFYFIYLFVCLFFYMIKILVSGTKNILNKIKQNK